MVLVSWPRLLRGLKAVLFTALWQVTLRELLFDFYDHWLKLAILMFPLSVDHKLVLKSNSSDKRNRLRKCFGGGEYNPRSFESMPAGDDPSGGLQGSQRKWVWYNFNRSSTATCKRKFIWHHVWYISIFDEPLEINIRARPLHKF